MHHIPVTIVHHLKQVLGKNSPFQYLCILVTYVSPSNDSFSDRNDYPYLFLSSSNPGRGRKFRNIPFSLFPNHDAPWRAARYVDDLISIPPSTCVKTRANKGRSVSPVVEVPLSLSVEDIPPGESRPTRDSSFPSLGRRRRRRTSLRLELVSLSSSRRGT